MEETLITFETAKLAKEKGFVDFKGINYNEIDSPDRNTKIQEFTFYRCYDKNPIMNYQKEAKLIVTTVGSSDIWGLVESYLNPSYITQTNYLAPTQGLLQKWLREVYNIEVDVMRYTYSGGEYQGKCYMWAIDKYDPNYNPETEDPWILETRESQGYDFKVYEEALEEGLYQALLLV